MRVLLDECLPRRLRAELTGHDVSTVPEMGWAGVQNGELLSLAAATFDVFLTVDSSIEYQQDVPAFGATTSQHSYHSCLLFSMHFPRSAGAES